MFKIIKRIGLVIFFTILIMNSMLFGVPVDSTIFTGNVALIGGIIRGTMSEYVFYTGQKVSELNWDMKNILYTGFSAQFSFFEHIDILGKLKYGYNDHIGKIEDSDWDNDDTKTNFSKHDCMLEKMFIAELSAGYSFNLLEQIKILPVAGIYALDTRMSAVNGYLEYPPGSPRENIFGTSIIYKQRYIIPRIGLHSSFSYYIFNFDLWGYAGFHGRCQAVDNHLKRNLDFYDELGRIKSYEVGGAFAVKLTDGVSFKVSALNQYIPLQNGSDYYIDTTTGGSSIKTVDSSGIKMKFTDVSASLQFLF